MSSAPGELSSSGCLEQCAEYDERSAGECLDPVSHWPITPAECRLVGSGHFWFQEYWRIEDNVTLNGRGGPKQCRSNSASNVDRLVCMSAAKEAEGEHRVVKRPHCTAMVCEGCVPRA